MTRMVATARRFLRRGHELSSESWALRHRALVLLLWLHIPALFIFGFSGGHRSLVHVLSELVPIAALSVAAGWTAFGKRVRSLACAVGLEEEFEIIKTHTTIGAKILSGARSPLLQLAEEIALTHRKRWDGTGYAHLEGEAIPLAGRIVSVVDTFDALTHARPYKRAWTVGDAARKIRRVSGTQFDPRVADAFMSVVDAKDLVASGSR